MAKNKNKAQVTVPELDPTLAALLPANVPTPETEAPKEDEVVADEPEADTEEDAVEDTADAGVALDDLEEAVPANVSLLVWPQDQYGVTSNLKPALIEAAGRMTGDADKLKALLDTIEYAKKHILARFASQVEDRAATLRHYQEQEAIRNARSNQH